MREILFIAGETSGDLHGSGVARAIKASGAPFALVGVGGNRMRDAGVELIEHVEHLAHFGLVEPLRHLSQYRRLKSILRKRIASGNVAVVVLIDYGGFNMQMAAVAADAHVPVLYFITPQVWASRAKRMRKLARTVTRAAVILPFEEQLLRDNGVAATFVGHPLLDQIATMPDRKAARAAIDVSPDDTLLVLFPGSRTTEIARHLAPFVATATELQRRIPELKVVVSAAPHVTIPKDQCPYPQVYSASFTLLRAADAALCKSGTTTLEAAVALCPLVVAYRTDSFTYAIGKHLVTIPFIGLVNVVAGRQVAPEFVQDALEPIAVANALEPLLEASNPRRAEMIRELTAVRDSLGMPGAAQRVADMAIAMANASAT